MKYITGLPCQSTKRLLVGVYRDCERAWRRLAESPLDLGGDGAGPGEADGHVTG